MSKNQDSGFTLIELTIILVIISILSAIALPSFISQANKAREAEAKQYLGAISRGMQAFFQERQRFTDTVDVAAPGIPPLTKNYSYSIQLGADIATINAEPQVEGIDPYLAAVAVVIKDGTPHLGSVMCEGASPSANTAQEGIVMGDRVECPTGFVEVF